MRTTSRASAASSRTRGPWAVAGVQSLEEDVMEVLRLCPVQQDPPRRHLLHLLQLAEGDNDGADVDDRFGLAATVDG